MLRDDKEKCLFSDQITATAETQKGKGAGRIGEKMKLQNQDGEKEKSHQRGE